MPLPTPSGHLLAMIRMASAAIGADVIGKNGQGVDVVGHEAAVTQAIEQLRLGAVLQRVDATPTVWDLDRAATWRMSPVTTSGGAKGIFLDAWGRVLQVPRNPGEADAAYERRILADFVEPGTTNVGMAKLIDRSLGVTGTSVVESVGMLDFSQLDDGHRLDDGRRLDDGLASSMGASSRDDLWSTFLVVLPVGGYPSGKSQADVLAIVDRHRAAGTRLLGVTIART